MAELSPLYGSHDCSRKIREQVGWLDEVKMSVWTMIVAEKIRNQRKLLELTGNFDAAELLTMYLTELEFGDTTNREGHSAKVYFNALFGKKFSRDLECSVNCALNYG